MKEIKKRDFEEVVETIRRAEADVDTVLDAARLERREKPDNRLSAEQKMSVINGVMLLIGFLGLLAFLLVPFFVS